MRLAAGIVATAIALASQCAAAQNYPEKSIRLIIPYPPGGTTDILGRAIAQKLSDAFGQSVVPDNRAGAGGNVGSEIAAKSPPDGYTLLLAPVSPMAINVETTTPEELMAFVRAEIPKWAKAVKDSGAKLD